ncbi:MAG: tetratricopeptide repeat protein [Nitrospirae bacterium]|nr:tetratricopeptide repeat protein [Nitrospirota bacterium]
MTLGRFDTSFIALFSALIFVSHPIQTETVTYIVQRFASLATFFYLLSLVMYIKFRIHDTKKMHDAGYTIYDKENHTSCIMNRESCIVSRASCIMYLASLFSAVLAMKTKEIAFTLPIVITLYEFIFFTDSRFRRILYLIPLLLSMLIIPLNFIGINNLASDFVGTGQTTMATWNYLFTQFRVIATYMRLFLLPVNQNLFYDYPLYNSFLEPAVILSLLFLLSIFSLGTYLWVKGFKFLSTGKSPKRQRFQSLKVLSAGESPGRQVSEESNNQLSTIKLLNFKLISFGIFWFFIALSVESSIIPRNDFILEHRLYLPSIGLIIAFSTAIFYFASRITHYASQTRLLSLISRLSVPLLLATAVIILSIATYQRNTVWQTEVSLWEDTVSKSPKKAQANFALGNAYHSIGHEDKAIVSYRIAIKSNPYYIAAYKNLAISYISQGLFDEAIEQFQTAMRFMPKDNMDIYYNLGIAYHFKGAIDKAIDYYKIALSLSPNNPVLHDNLSIAYDRKGLTNKAEEHFHIAEELRKQTR